MTESIEQLLIRRARIIKKAVGKVTLAAGQRASDKELLTMKWFVEGVVGKIPE
jgi:hypothetical protein